MKKHKSEYRDIRKVQLRFFLISSFSVLILFIVAIPGISYYYSSREKMGAMIETNEIIGQVYELDKDEEAYSTELHNHPFYLRTFAFKVENNNQIIYLSNCYQFSTFINENFAEFKDLSYFQKGTVHVSQKIYDNVSYYGGFDNYIEVNSNRKLLINITYILCGIYVLLVLALFGLSFFVVKPLKSALDKQNLFIGNASHELKTPLAIIKSNAQLIGEKEQNQNIEQINNISYQIDSMNIIIKDLLALTELISKKSKTELVNISSILEAILCNYDVIGFERKLDFKCDIEPNIIAQGNQRDLQMMFQNIISNAFKYVDDKKIIKISLKKIKSKIQIDFYNTGCNVKSDNKQIIFDRFFVGQNRPDSSGLGLSIVKTICDKYHYKIIPKFELNKFFSLTIIIKAKLFDDDEI